MFSLLAGNVKVTWTTPLDNGGDPILGYRLYVENVLWIDAS